MLNKVKNLAIGGLLIALGIGLVIHGEANADANRVCPEDAVEVGYGEYTANQGWSKSACIPLDDIGAGKGAWEQRDVVRWVRSH